MCKGKNVFLTGGAGVGKCLGKDTPVLMHDKSIKMVQNIVVGDKLMGDDYTPRTVLGTISGDSELFKIEQESADDYVVNVHHILSLKLDPNTDFQHTETIDMTVKDYNLLSLHTKQLLVGYKASGEYSKISVKSIGDGPYYGFETDGNHRFLLGDETVTHNSFTISKYYDQAVQKYGSKSVFKTSSTGVSAILIGGKTLHSWAGIYLGKGTVDELIRKMTFPAKKRWKMVKVLFIDEISMIHPDLFDKLEKIARILKRVPKPFGGIQVIISGDFMQLPVVKSDKFCFEAQTWDKVVDYTVNLNKIIRQKDVKFQKILNEIRNGDISDENIEILNSRVNVQLTNEYGIEPTVLYPKNYHVDNLNNEKLNKLLETEKKYTYTAKYVVTQNHTNMSNFEIIEKIKKIDQRTLDDMVLCKGAQVVFKINIDVNEGIANGSRGIVVDFVKFESETTNNEVVYPIVQLLNGTKHITVPVDFIYEIDKEYKVVKTQIPLKLAWASTIHSCQGSTLDYVKVDIGDNIFECGQSYVALSRVKNLEGLTLTDFSPSSIVANPKVIEYYEKNPHEKGPILKAFDNLNI